MTPAISPRLLSLGQTAIYLGRSEKAVKRLVEKRAFRVCRADGRVFVDVKDLEKWIEGGKE